MKERLEIINERYNYLCEELLKPELRFPIFRHHLVDMLMEHGSSAVPLFRVHLFPFLHHHYHHQLEYHHLVHLQFLLY